MTVFVGVVCAAALLALVVGGVWAAIVLYVEMADERDATADETDVNRILDLA